MSEHDSNRRGADTLEAQFKGDNDEAAPTDGDVTWEVRRNRRWLDEHGEKRAWSDVQWSVIQPKSEEVSPGLFRLTYPQGDAGWIHPGSVEVKVSALVDGIPQSVTPVWRSISR